MSSTPHLPGTVDWMDLTVPDATSLRDFYSAVVGWNSTALDMGGYSDFVMMREGHAEPVSGICHARGPNAGLPSQWLIYINVADLDASLAECVRLGGKQLTPIRSGGPDLRYCIIQDPAGAACAIAGRIRPA
jgi:uncharacterized protein